MSDPGLSRRGLFTGAVARLRAPEPVDRAPSLPSDPLPPRPAVLGRGDARGLLEGHAAVLAGLVPDLAAGARVLVAGTGDPALAQRLRTAGLTVTEVHEAPDADRPGGSTGARLSALPHEDATFDAVLSACGPMFARDAPAAHAELLRVAAPGAPVAYTAWTGSGAVGRLLRLLARHGCGDDGRPAPLTWGREERLRQDLEALGVAFTVDEFEVTTPIDDPAAGAGPLLRSLGLGDPPRVPDQLRTEADALLATLLARSGTVPPRLRSRALLVRTGPGPAAPVAVP